MSENYPDLKSNQNFLALQSQLEGTENRIAVARRDYIEAVRVYNTELRTFPGVMWANTLYRSHKPMETFTVSERNRRSRAAGEVLIAACQRALAVLAFSAALALAARCSRWRRRR